MESRVSNGYNGHERFTLDTMINLETLFRSLIDSRDTPIN